MLGPTLQLLCTSTVDEKEVQLSETKCMTQANRVCLPVIKYGVGDNSLNHVLMFSGI